MNKIKTKSQIRYWIDKLDTYYKMTVYKVTNGNYDFGDVMRGKAAFLKWLWARYYYDMYCEYIYNVEE